jgi:hypothetical protein
MEFGRLTAQEGATTRYVLENFTDHVDVFGRSDLLLLVVT